MDILSGGLSTEVLDSSLEGLDLLLSGNDDTSEGHLGLELQRKGK